MSNNTVYLEKNGVTKEAPVGFSWTTFFFGIWPSLFRGDFKFFFIQLVAAIFTLNLSSLVFMFMYNKWSLKNRIESGWKATSVRQGDMKDIMATQGIVIKAPAKKKVAKKSVKK